MSLAIDVDEVNRVLLSDGWHDVAARSFALDSYEFLWSGVDGLTVHDLIAKGHEPQVLLGGGQSGICSIGFTLKDGASGQMICGPLTAVLAVQTAKVKSTPAALRHLRSWVD
jgi:hypothetical protein